VTESVPPILELCRLVKVFGPQRDVISRLATRAGLAAVPAVVRAVDDVSLHIGEGDVLGLVGESGCGKSTLGRIAAGLLRPSTGQVLYQGKELTALSPAAAKRAWLAVQMIFQDPYGSLNPRMRVADIIGEAPRVHELIEGDVADYVDAQLRQAGLDPSYKRRFPHQFSGGQRQRIGIARALAVRPKVLVCDEPVTALDVSIQAQIINLFVEMRERLGLSYLFISHDLGVVEYISDRVAVMYLGRIVEEASAGEIFRCANHPYTRALLAEAPRLDVRRRRFSALSGELPSPLYPPPGCHFHPRCLHAMSRCRSEVPALRTIAPGHRSACHLNDVR
jgi:peptide/nickel transport system ATP-binding protein